MSSSMAVVKYGRHQVLPKSLSLIFESYGEKIYSIFTFLAHAVKIEALGFSPGNLACLEKDGSLCLSTTSLLSVDPNSNCTRNKHGNDEHYLTTRDL